MSEKRRDPEDDHEGEKEGTGEYVDLHEEVLKPSDLRCGFGCFKPSFLQPFAHMYAFIPTLSLSVIASFAYGIYIMTQVTTLEKQFGITSTDSGIMLGANDVGYMVTILLWSHFAKDMHRPRVLSLATFLFGVSAMISVIPHFLMVTQAKDMYEMSGDNSADVFDSRSLCLARNQTDVKDPSEISESSATIRRIGYYVMFVSFCVQGISRSPRGPMTQTYIDDNVPKTRTGIYMGVMAGLAILGPVFGSSIGGVFSQIYVTLDDTSLSPRDPRFIGAWWLGFLLFSSIAFLAAIPLMLFPRRMPNAPVKQVPHPSMSHHGHHDHHGKDTKSEMKLQDTKKEFSSNQNELVTKTRWERWRPIVTAFFASLLRILKNPLYMLIVGCDSFMFLTIAGRITFYPKYLEQYFRIPTTDSNFYFGISIMLPLALGASSGGILTHRLKLTIRGCMILRWVTDGIGAVVVLLSMLVTCDQPTIFGLSNPAELLKLVSPETTNMTCDTSCMCTDQDFLPSCGSDNRSYFSPCHAGCMTVLPNRDFGDCGCVSLSPQFNQTVTPGYCEESCNSIIYYFILGALGTIVSGLNGVPTNLTQLRSVEDRDRSLSIGISGLLRSMIGFFAGPIVFGKVVDTACILWSDKGFCSLYDGNDLRIKLHVFAAGTMGLVIIVNGIIVLLTYKMDRYCKVYEWQRHGFDKEIAETKKKREIDRAISNGDMPEHAANNSDIPIWKTGDKTEKDSYSTSL